MDILNTRFKLFLLKFRVFELLFIFCIFLMVFSNIFNQKNIFNNFNKKYFQIDFFKTNTFPSLIYKKSLSNNNFNNNNPNIIINNNKENTEINSDLTNSFEEKVEEIQELKEIQIEKVLENTYDSVLKKEPDKIVDAVITAYTSTPDQTDDDPFIAASGKYVYDGMIAANWLPFGTKIKIPALYGDKVFTVDDRMNRRYGYGRLDVWLDTSKEEALKFGVKRLEVYVFLEDDTNSKQLVLAE